MASRKTYHETLRSGKRITIHTDAKKVTGIEAKPPKSYKEKLSSGRTVTITPKPGGEMDIGINGKATPPPKSPFIPKPSPQVTPPATPKQRQDAARKWFIGKAQTTLGYRKKLVAGEAEHGKNRPTLGKMYFYLYNPKHRATLPIYDMWPLVFPIEPYRDGFLGLNLHYLQGNQRRAFLNMLKNHTNNNKYDKSTRIQVTYDLIKRSYTMGMFATPCIHRYLYSHVLSKFIEIQADEWDYIIDLPLELFIEK